MRAAPTADLGETLELTDENVEMVLDEIRPYLMAGAASPFSLCDNPECAQQMTGAQSCRTWQEAAGLWLMPLFTKLLWRSGPQV